MLMFHLQVYLKVIYGLDKEVVISKLPLASFNNTASLKVREVICIEVHQNQENQNMVYQ